MENYLLLFGMIVRKAKLLNKKNGERVNSDGLKMKMKVHRYFEIRIQVDEITKDVSLMVTDFAKKMKLKNQKCLWDNQISSLKQVLGSS